MVIVVIPFMLLMGNTQITWWLLWKYHSPFKWEIPRIHDGYFCYTINPMNGKYLNYNMVFVVIPMMLWMGNAQITLSDYCDLTILKILGSAWITLLVYDNVLWLMLVFTCRSRSMAAYRVECIIEINGSQTSNNKSIFN